MGPTSRAELEDAYWGLAAERQRIFQLRDAGIPQPWTEDPILAEYKFCNTFRASDRVSQFLIRHVIYDDRGWGAEDLVLRIILFRLFSKESTWEALEATTGGLCVNTFDSDRLATILDDLRAEGPIYTSAFILCANSAFGMKSKHRNHLALLDLMMEQGLSKTLAGCDSLEAVFDSLIDFPLIGPFMAYQLAIDLNYSELLDFSENDFTIAGPGAMRGLQKVFSDFGGESPAKLILRMVDRQDEEFEKRGLEFDGLFGRPLHAIDCQSLFCETDKYSRVAFPQLKSNRVRIKARFSPNPKRLPLFYPPKWGINELATIAEIPEPSSTPDERSPQRAQVAF